GTPVVLTGTWLGDTPGKVSFGGVPAKPSSWTNEKIEVAVPSGAKPGPIAVTVEGRELNLLPFELVVPVLKTLTPAMGQAGTAFELGGTGFGASAQAGKVLFGDKEAKTTAWSDTRIAGVVPILPLDKKEISVKVIVNEIATYAKIFQVPQFPEAGAVEEAGGVMEW